MTITIRPAEPRDCDAVAALHIGLSRLAYAHIFSADHLGERLAIEKQALWHQRLSGAPEPEKRTINVAELNGTVCGFSCFVFDDDDPLGAYLHNLYVHTDAQKQGLAGRLIAAGLDRFPQRFADRGVYLKALEKNLPACRLYHRWGGEVLDKVEVPDLPHPPVIALRFVWPSPNALRQAIA